MPALTALSRIAPPLAAEVGWRVWRHVGAPEPVHARDADVHSRAVRETVRVGGSSVETYRWGDGKRVILLVHGWRSRASRFSAVIRALEAPDATIIAFDAPANGDSPGQFVTILDYAAVITELARRHGPLDTIVGHSFGVLSSMLAVREGVPVSRIVAIAGMYNADQLVQKFSEQAGLGTSAQRGLRRRIERRTFPAVRDPWHRFVAEIDPAHTHVPLLIIHDADDVVVDPGQALLIADAHTGSVTSLITSDLGHSRILGDPEVVAAVVAFAGLDTRPSVATQPPDAAVPTRSEASSPGNQ